VLDCRVRRYTSCSRPSLSSVSSLHWLASVPPRIFAAEAAFPSNSLERLRHGPWHPLPSPSDDGIVSRNDGQTLRFIWSLKGVTTAALGTLFEVCGLLHESAGHGMRGATLCAATIKEVNAMSDNVQEPAQSLSCLNCGHAVPLPAASTSVDTLVICPACGADLGRWGDVKES
jgi:hypothetical protein